MRSSVREIVRIVLVSLVVMLTVPVAYRIWLAYHPQAEKPGRSVSQFFAEAAEENALRLLKTPIPKWTEGEKRSEPKVRAWLEVHEKTVLPWEWTDEARRKDPDGYRKLWADLFERQGADLKAQLKAEQKALKDLERKIRIVGTVFAHRTNQLARVRAAVATNEFPVTIRVERLTRGRLWGWNTREESVVAKRRDDLHVPTNGWLWVEQRQAETERAALSACESEKQAAVGRLSVLPTLLAHAGECAGLVLRAETLSEAWAMKELLGAIRTTMPARAIVPADTH